MLMECAKQESTICNVIVSVYTLSKLNDCKESFVRAGAAQSLYRLSNEPSGKVSSMCVPCWLQSSEGNEHIEVSLTRRACMHACMHVLAG